MDDDVFDRWPDAERVLDAVLDLVGPERHRRAVELCGPDAALRRLVESLLWADVEAAPLPADPAGLIAIPDDLDELPARVAGYRIERELGRGGMGRVLLGRREDV